MTSFVITGTFGELAGHRWDIDRLFMFKRLPCLVLWRVTGNG